MSKITIIYDDRENKGWNETTFPRRSFTLARKRLSTGDYTIKGLEQVVAIERKSGWDEILTNLSTKRNYNRFADELKRMTKYPVRLLIVEASWRDMEFLSTFTGASNPLPILNAFISRCLFEFNIPVLAIGRRSSHTRAYVSSLFKSIAWYKEHKSFYFLKG